VLKRRQIAAILVLLLGSAPAMSIADEILRDPTRPYVPHVPGVAAAPRFVVNAIIVSAERRVAIVNGRRVSIGGSVNGATVVSIAKDQLVLEQDGERITIGLNR